MQFFGNVQPVKKAYRIVLTRAQEDNRVLREKLGSLGFEILGYPCISTRFLPYTGEKIEGRYELEDFAVIAFTSRRGVLGMQPVFDRLRRVPGYLAAVGKATAGVLDQKTGRKADIVPAVQTGENLALEIIARSRREWTRASESGVRILHVRGGKVNPEFRRILEQADFRVSGIVVYETVRPRIETPAPDDGSIVVFASPSAVETFFSVNDPFDSNYRYIVIGPVTARRLEGFGIKDYVVAQSASADGLVQAIAVVRDSC